MGGGADKEWATELERKTRKGGENVKHGKGMEGKGEGLRVREK